MLLVLILPVCVIWQNHSGAHEQGCYSVAIGKARVAYVQSFALWQQATIEFTCHDHSVIACSRGESHNQRNATREVATTSPPFYNEPHRSHVLCVKAELSTTSTSWSQHHFVTIGKARAAYAQNIALWQQATIECTCHDHAVIACLRSVHIVFFFMHIPFVVNHTINAMPPERLQQQHIKKKQLMYFRKTELN